MAWKACGCATSPLAVTRRRFPLSRHDIEISSSPRMPTTFTLNEHQPRPGVLGIFSEHPCWGDRRNVFYEISIPTWRFHLMPAPWLTFGPMIRIKENIGY